MTSRFVPPDGVAYAAVILDRPAPPGGLTVVLTSLDTAVCTVPAAVNVEEGWIGAQFPITYAGVGQTQVKAALDGVEVFLDVVCAGVVPSVRPALAVMAMVDIRPEGVAAASEDARPAADVAVSLRPDGSGGVEPEGTPEPGVAKTLRPKPYYAGE